MIDIRWSFSIFVLLPGVDMPKDFLECIANGGHVITVKHGEEKYQHVCYDKKGKPHYGEIKEKKHKEDKKPKKHKKSED